MKKVVLSALALLMIGAVGASGDDLKLYTDDKGQVFTSSGEGRTELKTKNTNIFDKASKLQFSGTHYLGYTYKNKKDASATGNFELRRNYVEVKAYLLENQKSYFRVTLDAVYSSAKDDYANIFAKYAYLYIDDILPFTGVEIGMAHRPWIDYEEHQGWWMRSIAKVFVEADEAGHLSNSADLGFNFKTKTEYFTSEVGIFNGEGYHGKNGTDEEIGSGNSAEWRLTGAFLGNGKVKRNPKQDSYADASFFGQYNMANAANEVVVNGTKKAYDYSILGVHSVYNMPSFLIAAQYIQADNNGANQGSGTSQFNGKGYSINADFRFGVEKKFSIIARYDTWEAEQEVKNETYKTKNAIYGLAWQQNKNLKWLLSGQSYRAEDNKNYKGSIVEDFDAAMITAEVHW